MKEDKCKAPWGCNNKADGRYIDGFEVCRPCYQYVWEKKRKGGKRQDISFHGLKGPHRWSLLKGQPCSRKGCNKIVSKKVRAIGGLPYCRACYQAIWERAKKRGLNLAQSAKKIEPK